MERDWLLEFLCLCTFFLVLMYHDFLCFSFIKRAQPLIASSTTKMMCSLCSLLSKVSNRLILFPYMCNRKWSKVPSLLKKRYQLVMATKEMRYNNIFHTNIYFLSCISYYSNRKMIFHVHTWTVQLEGFYVCPRATFTGASFAIFMNYVTNLSWRIVVCCHKHNSWYSLNLVSFPICGRMWSYLEKKLANSNHYALAIYLTYCLCTSMIK